METRARPLGSRWKPAGALAPRVREIEPERLYELLHGRRQDPAFAVEDGERAREGRPLELEDRKRPLEGLLGHRGLRHDRDPMVDLDGALHRLDVVVIHDRLDVDVVLAEDLVDGLAGRGVGIETYELLPGEVGHGHLVALG